MDGEGDGGREAPGAETPAREVGRLKKAAGRTEKEAEGGRLKKAAGWTEKEARGRETRIVSAAK